MNTFIQWPKQKLSFSAKNKKWRKSVLDWADSKVFFNYAPVRNSTIHKKINYDLVNGTLHMQDLEAVINPENLGEVFIPKKLQHYPTINSKLNVLRGEESTRLFDYKVIVTNPTAVSEIERVKSQEIFEKLQALVENTEQSDMETQSNLSKLGDYFTYQWQDFREIRANSLLNHYNKEMNFSQLFNAGFMDALIVGEEIYQTDIVGGEPTLTRLNPLKVHAFRSGYSNRLEDADIIILEDYWAPGKIIDYFYDSLSKADMDYIERVPTGYSNGVTDSMGNYDDRLGFVNSIMIGEEMTSQNGFFWNSEDAYNGVGGSLMPYDISGNIRVLRVYWKSWRKVKKVKYFDLETGEETYDFFPETHVINKDLGEEETIYWINEAWEGTKIGQDIYVNMRPRVVQYNRLSNPSRCHFGIIGTIYNLNDSKPFSLVDMMKPYAYLYDIISDRLNHLISKNIGKLLTLDLAKVPANWDISKWLYYAKMNNIAVVDSFKEGNVGASTNVLAGAISGSASHVTDMELGNSIQYNINLLSYIKSEMSEVAGISRQREGQIANRETVGGVERATLQSSQITEWLFKQHDDVKHRVLEAFLETAKIAMRGRSKKFQYILSDGSMKVMDIDGDEFAECDYGLVVDNGTGTQILNQQIDALAQAALQNGYKLSVIAKMYTSQSIMEKVRMLESEENKVAEQQQQAQQQEQQYTQEMQQQALELEQVKREHQDALNQRDNDTKIAVARINSEAEAQRFAMMFEDDGIEEMTEAERTKFRESQRQFDVNTSLKKAQMEIDKSIANRELDIKARQARNKGKKIK